jgi:hypothetical protein
MVLPVKTTDGRDHIHEKRMLFTRVAVDVCLRLNFPVSRDLTITLRSCFRMGNRSRFYGSMD